MKIKLPDTFNIDQKVTILIEEDESEDYKKKIDLMKQSVNDAAFQKDLKEISDDFDPIDYETIK